MDVLLSEDKRDIERKSSIDQFKNHLSVYGQGGWLPIEYDVLDHIGCDDFASHRAILSLDPNDIGYNYKEAECSHERDAFILSDDNHAVREFTNADNGVLGEHNEIRRRVGLDFYVCKETLPAVE